MANHCSFIRSISLDKSYKFDTKIVKLDLIIRVGNMDKFLQSGKTEFFTYKFNLLQDIEILNDLLCTLFTKQQENSDIIANLAVKKLNKKKLKDE